MTTTARPERAFLFLEDDMPHDRLLPLPELERKVGFKKSKIYYWIANDAFPPGKLMHGKRLWLESEIDAWIAAEWKKAS